jgi:hypothetical protein
MGIRWVSDDIYRWMGTRRENAGLPAPWALAFVLLYDI